MSSVTELDDISSVTSRNDWLTVNDEVSWTDSGRQSSDGDKTRHATAVVISVYHEPMSPPLGGMMHHAQSSSSAQPCHVRHAELGTDVASSEEDLNVRRWVSAERHAPQDAGDSLHERQSSVFTTIAVSRLNSVRLAMINLRAIVID